MTHRFSRRDLLAGLGASLGMATLGWGRLSLASTGSDQRFVLVILRGGLDGLAVVPPHADPSYATARGKMALPGPSEAKGVVDLDGFFGLHPALSPMMPLWEAQELAVVQAVGLPYRGRSHFDAQDVLENGTDQPRARKDGWLNRALGDLAKSPRPAMAIGRGIPLILRGQSPVSSLDPNYDPAVKDDFLTSVQALYRGDPMLSEALAEGLSSREWMADHVSTSKEKGGRRGPAAIRRVIETTGTLLAAPDGPNVAVLEAGGWDSHANQGGVSGGLARRLAALAEGLVGLREASLPVWSKTVIAVVSEFGRTVSGNGTGGTDHGTGGVALLAGGAVRGGQVFADWPGLGKSALLDGRDLMPTTDLRAVFKSILLHHLAVDALALEREVFPDSASIQPISGLLHTG